MVLLFTEVLPITLDKGDIEDAMALVGLTCFLFFENSLPTSQEREASMSKFPFTFTFYFAVV